MLDTHAERSDAAALSYLRACLDGRANRLRRTWCINRREVLATNDRSATPGATEGALGAGDQNWDRHYKQVVDRMALDKAMSVLTAREARLIFELFWAQKTVTDVCAEHGVSKNSVLKMKRNALRKMKKALNKME